VRLAGPQNPLVKRNLDPTLSVMEAHEDERSPGISRITVGQLLSWCLEWLKLPLHFAAQNTEALLHSAILLDILAHTFPVIATQEFRSPFIREMPSEWQIIITAD
jgi:hypothetical protein